MATASRTGKSPRPSRRVMKSLLTPVGLDEAEKVVLPAILGMKEAGPVRDQLLGLRGKTVDLDGSQVERLGALGLQVLLSASATWRADGQRFRVVDASEAFRSSLALFGAASLTATNA